MKSMPISKVICYAICSGILAILIGYGSKFIVKPFTHVSLPDVCKEWNKKYVMEWSLFIVGVVLFLVWYGLHFTSFIPLR